MGKEKRSKHRYSRSEESSRRSRSLSNRSSSSESYKHRSKKNKHKEDKKRKHESKKDKKNKKEEKREDRKEREIYRERERLTQRERPVKIEQEHIEDMGERYPNNLKEEKIEAEKIEYEEQQQQLSNREREMLRINDNPEEEQQHLEEDNKPKKEQPNFEPSGILLEYYNSREGVSLRFHEPPEAREPQEQWRMYIFKGEEVLSNFFIEIDLDPIELTKSSYLIGKDDRVVDILAENPSISRQHCVIQFRLIQRRQTEGDYLETVKPYIMDLESTNGTFLNDEKIESGRYYELLHRDVLKFGFSDREYVIVRWEEDNQQENGDGDGGN